MTPPLVEYLTGFKDTHVTIASNIKKDAAVIAKRFSPYASSRFLDIHDTPSLEEAIRAHKLVISFIPPFMHMPVIKACLKMKRHLLTSSYISPEQRALHDQVKAADLIFMNESGLDPGIDIMGTMKIVHEA